MKQSTIAAIVSGLILPGLGQIVILKRTRRGLAFMLPAIAAAAWLLLGLAARASEMMAEVPAGTLPADPVEFAMRLSEQGTAPGSTFAALVLLACWFGSVVDALFSR